jgi:hypothetical protein
MFRLHFRGHEDGEVANWIIIPKKHPVILVFKASAVLDYLAVGGGWGHGFFSLSRFRPICRVVSVLQLLFPPFSYFPH